MRIVGRFLSLALITLLAGSCKGDESSGMGPTEPQSTEPIALTQGTGNEEELFGDIFVDGVRVTSGNFLVEMNPDAVASSHLVGFAPGLGAQYARDLHFGWFDPAGHDGPCGVGATKAEKVADYLDGRSSADSRYWEVHNGTDQPTPGSIEGHCVRPGGYVLTIEGPGTEGRSIPLDYVAVESNSSGSPTGIYHPGSTDYYQIEADSYLSSDSYADLLVDFELGATNPVRPVPNFRGDAASGHTAYYNPTTGDLSGLASTVYRFSLNESNPGTPFPYHRLLGRLYWDYSLDRGNKTGFWSVEEVDIRAHSYDGGIGLPRCIQVGAELMRPDNAITGVPDLFKYVSVDGSSCAAGADLIPVAVTPGATSVIAGASLSVPITYANAGTIPTTSASTAKIYLSTSEACCGGATQLGSSVSIPASFANATLTSTTVIGTVPTTPGTYYVYLVVNEGTATSEREPSNNKLQAVDQVTISASSLPDLQATTVKTYYDYFTGQSDTIVSVGVRNAGTATAQAGWAIHAFISADSTLDAEDDPAGTKTIATSLAPSASIIHTSNRIIATIPCVATGNYYVIVKLDATGTVTESTAGEGNNVRVSGPILITRNNGCAL